MKIVGDGTGSLIWGVNYSNYLQLIFILFTASPFCYRCVNRRHDVGLKMSLFNYATADFWSIVEEFVCLLRVEGKNPVLCLAGIDERSGSGPWGQGQQNSQSFNQGRVRSILIYHNNCGGTIFNTSQLFRHLHTITNYKFGHVC